MASIAEAATAVEVDRLPEVVATLRAAEQPDGHEGARAAAIAGLLAHPAIAVEVVPVLPGRPNVVARVRGRDRGPGVLLDGHCNSGYHPGPWSGDPRRPWVADGRLHGGAVSDMLGGLAAMILGLRAVADHGPPPGDVVLLAGMHADTNGLGTKVALASRDDWPAFGICGDPTDLDVVTHHGGAVKFEIELTGRAAHISRREEGIDALAAAAEVARALPGTAFAQADPAAWPSLAGLPCLVVGELQAGTSPALVADRAVLRGDVRTLPGMTTAGVLEDLDARAASAIGPGVGHAARLLVEQPPFLDVGSGPLVAAILAASAAHGARRPEVGAPLPARRYCTEAADMARAGIASVVYGPGDWRWAPDESVALADLATAARVYATVAATLGLEEA